MSKIGNNAFFSICYSLCVALFPCLGTALIINSGKNSSLIAAPIGFILGFLVLLMILYVYKYNNNMNIFEANKKRFGLFGELINILYILGTLFVGAVISWGIVNFIITHLLVRSNDYIISLLLFSIVSIAVIKGKEVISGSNLILTFIIFVSVITSFLFLSTDVDIENIYPLFDVNKGKFIYTCLIIPSFCAYPYITILSLKKEEVVPIKNTNKAVILSYIFGCLSFYLFLFYAISIYGVNLASDFAYPEYYIFKKIDAFNFIQRVENVLALVIFFAVYGLICFLIRFVKKYIVYRFRMTNKKKIGIMTYFLTISLPLISTYVFINYKPYFLLRMFPFVSSILVVALFINFIFLLLKRKKNI